MKVVFASNNVGKIREVQALLQDLELVLLPQGELGLETPPETGLTFVENALLKARHACRESGLPAIADDSGLVVDALGGEPGLYSARYAGPEAGSKENIQKLLTALQDLPLERRGAAFYCTLVYLAHEMDPTPLICSAFWRGRILLAPQGEKGFGYDPVFVPMNESRSVAELPLDQKNALSHRGQALALLLKQLPEKLASSSFLS